MNAILAITAAASSLRAVVRDPAVRLWTQFDYLGVPDARCQVDGHQDRRQDQHRRHRWTPTGT